MAAGLRDWARLTGSREDLALAATLESEAWRRFFRDTGWQVTDNLMLPGIAVERAISDGPLPSPAALLIGMSLESEDPQRLSLAQQALQIGYQLASEQPLWYSTQVAASILSVSRTPVNAP